MMSAAEIGMFMAIVFYVLASARIHAESAPDDQRAAELSTRTHEEEPAPTAAAEGAQVLRVGPDGCRLEDAPIPCDGVTAKISSARRVLLEVAGDTEYAQFHPVLLQLSAAGKTPLLPE